MAEEIKIAVVVARLRFLFFFLLVESDRRLVIEEGVCLFSRSLASRQIQMSIGTSASGGDN